MRDNLDQVLWIRLSKIEGREWVATRPDFWELLEGWTRPDFCEFLPGSGGGRGRVIYWDWISGIWTGSRSNLLRMRDAPTDLRSCQSFSIPRIIHLSIMRSTPFDPPVNHPPTMTSHAPGYLATRCKLKSWKIWMKKWKEWVGKGRRRNPPLRCRFHPTSWRKHWINRL